MSAAVKMLRELAHLRFQHALERSGHGQDVAAGVEAALLEIAGSICAVGAELLIVLERQELEIARWRLEQERGDRVRIEQDPAARVSALEAALLELLRPRHGPIGGSGGPGPGAEGGGAT